jgi:6-phosphogluconolactonase (cycloisomerase 2 family)
VWWNSAPASADLGERRRTRLDSANETDRVNQEKPPHGSVSSFSIDPKTGGLEVAEHGDLRRGRADLREVEHQSGKWLFVANDFGGSVAVLPIKTTARWANRAT